MAKRLSPARMMIKETIRESLDELKHGTSEFPEDPSLESSDEITGPERFAKGQKHKDEVVIDGLLADVSGKAGYFLKLKKELRPNEWMLMKVVDSEWRRWADIESAVADIVKEHTKKSPTKWGSGAYRIEIACKGGMRGRGYDPIDYHINAEEEFVVNPAGPGVILPPVDPSLQMTGQLDTLTQLMGVVKDLVPKAVDPATIQTQIASAFQQGLQTKAGDSNNSTTMMVALMTGMMGMMKELAAPRTETRTNQPQDEMKGFLSVLKDFGVLAPQTAHVQEKPHSITDVIKELQLLGIDLLKKDDPLDQVNKLKQIASIASDFMGMGSGNSERPGIMEKIVDMVAPALPGIVKDIRESTGNALRLQEVAGQNMERARQLGGGQQQVTGQHPGEQTTFQQMNGQPHPQQNTEASQMSEQVKQFFNNLYDAVNVNNKLFYPIVYTSLLQDSNGQQLLQGIASRTHGPDHLITMLQQYGDVRFKDSEFVLKHLVGYVNGFIIWVRQMLGGEQQPEQVPQNGRVKREFDVECTLCHTVYSFNSEQDFGSDPENKNCGGDLGNGTFCQGVLQPLAKV